MTNVKFPISSVKLISLLYLAVIVGLLLYSYTQVDLGLTLTRQSFLHTLQTSFQHTGYFQRPLSTFLYLLLLTFLYVFYFLFLYLAKKKGLGRKSVWFLIITTSVMLTFSYNAFSHDLFNYIFDAKIVTHYGQNPYEHKALDFPNDPMLAFMHWTHRTYPYGSVWLFLTVPPSLFGLQVFLLTFFLFKALMSLAYIGSVFALGKLLKKLSPENELFSIVFFGLNPLVIIESLVSSHNDIVMMFFALVSIALLLEKKIVGSLITFITSIGIKFATLFLLPILITIFALQKKKESKEMIFLFATIIMVVPIIIASVRTNFQPWYLLYALPFSAVISKKYYVFIPAVVLSLFSLLRYVPYLYTGNWDPPIPTILHQLNIYAGIIAVSLTGIWFMVQRMYKS